MADMTHKHYVLISDAIKDGVHNAMKSVFGESYMDNRHTPARIFPVGSVQSIKTSILHNLIESFASKLAYTSDKFDREAFIKNVMG
jgi:hypothetical protein